VTPWRADVRYRAEHEENRVDVETLVRILDERDIGDPAVAEDLALAVPDFREDLEELDDALVVYLVGIASLFVDPVRAWMLLRRSLPLLGDATRVRRLYERQLDVWKKRRDKSQHDLEYLQIVLGVKEHRPDAWTFGGEETALRSEREGADVSNTLEQPPEGGA